MRILTQKFAALRDSQSLLPPSSTDPDDSESAYLQDEIPPLRPRVEIPICDPGTEAHALAKTFGRGQFLARQDAWEDVSREIRDAEKQRSLTPGLASIAQVIAKGCRSDAIYSVGQAVEKSNIQGAGAILTAFATNLEEDPDDPALSYILAMSHVDVALIWRGASQVQDLAPQRRQAHDYHMGAAAALADRFDPFEQDSPLWAQVRCAVIDSDPCAAQRVADDFEDLIDLDPQNPFHLVALGQHLLPRRLGTLEMLDRQARRKVAQLSDVWGAGAYTWVFMGALQQDPAAFRRLDPELFVEGMHEILDRHPSQHMANVMAAFTGLTIAAPSENNSARARVMDCFRWILQDHLRELHPQVWALAPVPGKPDMHLGDDVDLISLGRTRAIGSIAQHFAPALESGRRLVFTPDGLQLRKSI